MVPGSIGLTDEELSALEAQQGQPEITTGLVDRLAASPAPAQGFTDRELDVLPTLASTPFARERGIALPPEAPAEPEPMTDYELNQLEEENYRRVDYIMPQEEFRQYWTRRTEENNEVGRFIEGVGQGAAGMLAMIPEAGREIRDGMVGMVTDPVNQVQRNVQTGAETIRKAGINMVQLFDWVGNKVDDATTWAKRRGLKHQALAKRLEQDGKLTGDELQDANIIAAAASEADAMEPTPVENEEDFDKAYDRYQREKSLEQEFAGVTDFQVGASKMAAPATSKEAYQITNEQPAETLSMIGSMALDPVNLVPLGAGALSKLRVLRRTATLAGAPLRGVQRAADATADLAERMEFGISSRVQDITGLTAKQQAALGAGAAGAAVYADAAGGGGNVTAAVTALGSVLPGLRYGGAIIRKTGAAAGGAATIIREAGVGGIGTARAEAAADLARMTAIPERYRKYFTGYVDGTDSTLKRVAQDAGNPEALRRVARFADRAGVTTAARLADDVTSGAVAAGITGAPFAALQPDAERAGEVFGGIMALGGAGGLVGGAIGRRSTAPDADVARMMADVYAVGGNVDALSALPHASLDRMAAMQGVLAGKVDFVPLKADEYRMNKDVSATGGELAAGLFLEKDANGRARVFINLDARKSAGGVGAIVPHEIGHAILTSNILDGQPRNDLRNLVNQQYGADGVQARGREYVGRLVDGDIQNGTTGELPQVLTEQEFRDLESGNKSPSDIAKGRKLEPSERERLINERYEELSQQSIERGEDALDWARDEVIAETFASEAPAIDFRGIRRDGAFPRLAESMLAAGGRVLEVMGVRLDGGTGKLLDNPSVLFRDNPLFQDRIMQKRVKEYVRAYDQYLVGLEEAGSATPRGVELARSSRPQDMARSTHVKLRDEGRGVLENDFLFQKPDGTYSYKPQPIINAAEANRAAQIKTLYDAKKFVPVNSTEFGKRKVNGREVVGGPVLPPQFDLFTQFPQHVRQFARGMEASRAEGGSWNIDYNAIGTGSSGRYRITNMGAVRAIQRETVPFGWQVTKQNHLLAASLDLNAFRASAMRAINKGELGIFNNDMKQVEADLKTYLANHRNGRPGEMTIGQQKRDTLNGLIGTGTAVQRAANPLYAELNPRGSIRTWRIDRLNDAQPSGRTGYFFDYDKINNNRMPQQIPRGAQGMPDAPASGRGDGMSERWDAYTESLLDDVESWANARDTGRIDYDMQDVVQSFVDFARKNSQLAGDDLAKAFYRDEKPTASQRKKLNAALENVGQPPKAAPRGQAMPDVAPMRKRRVYRGVSPDMDYSSGDQFWSTSKEVAENYAFQTQSPGRVDTSLTTELPQNLYRATNKDELRDDLGIKAEPYSFEFDTEVKAALQAQGYEGVRYNAGTDLGGDQAMELHIFGKPKPSAAKRGQAMPDAVHGDNTPLPSQVPDRGFYIIGTKPTADGRVLEYHLDPATTVQPRVADIDSIRGEQVAMLEADRHNTRSDNMGGPLHPFLISNQTIARLLDGRGFKAVWANMNSAFVTRAKNIVKNTTAGHALIQIMKENAHRSNRKFVMDVTSEIDARRANMTSEQADFLHVLLELGAINPQAHINKAYSRIKRASDAALEGEATMAEVAEAQRDYDQIFDKYQPMVEFLNRLSPLKSHATRGRSKEFAGEFASVVSKHGNSPWYSSMASKYRNTKFVDEAARFSFKQRGAAMDRITGIPFAPDVKAMLQNSMDFVNGQNLDVVGVVQLSKDMDAFAVYFGKNAKEEAKMSANERMLRDQFLASGTFKAHPSYDWVMLGPENADSFILDAPADPLKLFPDYAKNHPNPKVKKGSKETVVGTMKKSKIPLVLK
jgi:hypothetical protein